MKKITNSYLNYGTSYSWVNDHKIFQQFKINSSIYQGMINTFMNLTLALDLTNYLTQTNYYIPLILPQVPINSSSTFILDYTVSKDFTKLIVVFSDSHYNKSMTQVANLTDVSPVFLINYYEISHLQLKFIKSTIIPNDMINSDFTFHFIPWRKDSAMVYFSYFNSTQTILSSFNYTSLKENTIINSKKSVFIDDINTKDGYIVTGSSLFKQPAQIYTYKDLTLNLAQTTTDSLLYSNILTNKIILLNELKNTVNLMTYTYSTNNLQENKVLAKNIISNELNVVSTISNYIILITFLSIITTIGLSVSDLKYASNNKNHS